MREVALGAGVGGARLFGHPAGLAPHAGDLAHAVAGVVALAVASTGLAAGFFTLGAVILSAALRAVDLPSADRLLPRTVAWSVLLRPCAPGTRRMVASVADRARRVAALPRITLGALLVAMLSPFGGLAAEAAAAAGLLALAGVCAWLSRAPSPDTAGPEAAAARALVALAARLPPEDTTAVAVCGGTSADGAGVAAILDWWGVPSGIEVDLVGLPDAVAPAAAALTRAGWRVRVVTPSELSLREAP